MEGDCFERSFVGTPDHHLLDGMALYLARRYVKKHPLIEQRRDLCGDSSSSVFGGKAMAPETGGSFHAISVIQDPLVSESGA